VQYTGNWMDQIARWDALREGDRVEVRTRTIGQTLTLTVTRIFRDAGVFHSAEAGAWTADSIIRILRD
jgi:hypothetical protein